MLTGCFYMFTVCILQPIESSRKRSPLVTRSQEAQHGRLWAADRRKQLLHVAASLLAEEGVDGVRIPDVATLAGVSRPVVYKHFSNRQDILVGILEDFGLTLQNRVQASLGTEPEKLDLQAALKAVIEATCDVLEERGAGAWNLLSSTGTDPVLDEVARRVRGEILEPWVPKIGEVTGLKGPALRSLSQMTAACARTNLSMWLEGEWSRRQAVKTLIRATTALLKEFTR